MDNPGEIKISGRIIAAAPVLTGISQAEFAAAAGLPIKALCIRR
jgi:hypothetical protein